jgi:hypothetical protein
MTHVAGLACPARAQRLPPDSAVLPPPVAALATGCTVRDVLAAFQLPADGATLLEMNAAERALRDVRAALIARGTGAPRAQARGLSMQCRGCGSRDDASFVCVPDAGDMVCTRCGAVAVDHLLHEGESERTFADEDDAPASRSHAQRPSDFARLFSEHFQLRTARPDLP